MAERTLKEEQAHLEHCQDYAGEMFDALKTAVAMGFGGECPDWCKWQDGGDCDCGLKPIERIIARIEGKL